MGRSGRRGGNRPPPDLEYLLSLCRHLGRTPHHRDGGAQRARGLYRADFTRPCRALRLRRLYGGPLRHTRGIERVGSHRRGRRRHVGRRRRRGCCGAPRLGTLSRHGHHRLRLDRRGCAHRVGLSDGGTRRHLQYPQARAAHALLDRDARGGAGALAHGQSPPLGVGARLPRRQEQRGGSGITRALGLLRADRRLHGLCRLRRGSRGALHVSERLHLARQLHAADFDPLSPRLALRRPRAHRGTRRGERGADHPAGAADEAPRLPAHLVWVAATAVDLLAARRRGRRAVEGAKGEDGPSA